MSTAPVAPHYQFVCLAFFISVLALGTSTLRAQDGAGYNPDAKTYRAPALSLAGSTDTPERLAALGPLWQGKFEESVAALKRLADGGDVISALFLAALYRKQSKLPIEADPALALHYYRIASSAGSGEASEHIAEMTEEHEIPAQAEGGADYWRSLAVKQGWNEQRLEVACFNWTHEPKPIHCEIRHMPGRNMPTEYQQQCPTESEMKSLVKAGLTGTIRMDGGDWGVGPGPGARAILVLDHTVPGETDLMVPDATSVIYIQTPQDRWRMIPASARLLNRFIILKPESAGVGYMGVAVQAVDGSQSGGACGEFTH